MRRARIKAIATVPVRRKAQLQAATTEPAASTSENTEEKPPEVKVEPTENSSTAAEQKEVDKASSTIVEKKETDKISSIKLEQKEVDKVSSTTVEQKETDKTVLSETIKNVEEIIPSDLKTTKDIVVPEDVPAATVKVPEKLSIPLEKEKESTTYVETRTFENASDSESKTDTESTTKVDSLQKVSTSTVEGSPVKSMQSRSCFMRPIPRLDGGGRIRRNSVQGSGASASESEDDCKRSSSFTPSRVRNDSVCSVQSLKDNSNTSNIAKLNLGQKRRMVVSESARKLAEARREFLLKHENKPPDKSKLTMYDLIYYNPTTNPMKPKPVAQKPNSRRLSVCSIPEKKKEEPKDEPPEMVVPQVKVGPNGQLIIDEQSLVIDQYKAQENIDRSDIIVDEDTTGNGFYKKRQKSKEWTKWETVKFYKALNTYGTDFLLMQSVFPKRTRQELKLKYKKEERLNRNLIEKALVYQEFDTEALQKDLASVEEKEKKELELSKPVSNKKKTTASSKKRKRCSVLSGEIEDEDDENGEENAKCNEQSSDENIKMSRTKVRKRATRKRNVIKSPDNSCDESGKDHSDSESEKNKAKPTRLSRTSKKTKKLSNGIQIFDVEDKKETDTSPNNSKKRKRNIIEDSENECQSEFQNNGGNNNGHHEDDGKNKSNCNKQDHDNVNRNENVCKDDNKNEENDCHENVDNNLDDSCLEMPNELDITENIEFSNNNIVNQDKTDEVQNQNELSEKSEINSNIKSNALDGIIDDIPNIANLKPGSLVVLKKDSDSGQTSLQVYIVSADYDPNNPNYKDSLKPIDLSPDVLESVTNCIKTIPPQSFS